MTYKNRPLSIRNLLFVMVTALSWLTLSVAESANNRSWVVSGAPNLPGDITQAM